MQKVRQHRQHHSGKLVKAGPIDKKKEKATICRLNAGSNVARDRVTPQIVRNDLPTPARAPAVGNDRRHNVVEKLRERLDRLSIESAPILNGVRSPESWLLGKPCPLEADKCKHTLQLLGHHHLAWPFPPMIPQVAIAERVLHACDHGHVSLLQSPTGTGKSIALLTSVLAWQRRCYALQGSAPQIIYGVRTHAQATQMVHELGKMPYRPRMAIIGSREQLCINDEVKLLAKRNKMSLNSACRQAARRAVQPARQGQLGADCACESYVRLGDADHARKMFECCGREGKVWDMEDLVASCKSLGGRSGCPYYSSHVLAGNADIVFCPHNYILDPAVAQCKSHHRERWSLQDRIVVIDEGHNLEQGCRVAGSLQISLTELRQVVADLKGLPKRHPHWRIRSHGREFRCSEVCAELHRVPELLVNFLEVVGTGSGSSSAAAQVHNYPRATSSKSQLPIGLTRAWGLPGHPSILEFIATSRLIQSMLSRGVEELCVELTDRLLRPQDATESAAQDGASIGILEKLKEVLTKLRLAVSHPDFYVAGVSTGGNDSGCPSLAVWLMSPGIVFDTLVTKAHAILVASGTLAPLGALSMELNSSPTFNLRAQPCGPLETGHVVQASQLLVALTSSFPGSLQPVVANYSNWKSDSFLLELGKTLLAISLVIPGGVLCFFPSYMAIDASVAAWQRASIWERLVATKKTVLVEPRSAEELNKTCAAFVSSVRGPALGALALAVYRGKLSEGLSFNDELCRGVVCVGVPYPQIHDPVVEAKRRWNDTHRTFGADAKSLSGNEWYELQAYRAVNQALGRCVRHRWDYGALVLLDARWSTSGPQARGLRRHLARWLQPFVEDMVAQHEPALLRRLEAHFAQARQVVQMQRFV